MLVGLGLVVLAYSGISFTTPGKPGNFLGMLWQTLETHFIPPVVGALVLVGGIALLAVLTGCVGYVGGGYGGPVVVPGPSVYFWGGDYDRGRDVHVYSQRGYQSRAAVHRGGHEMERR